MKKEGSAFTIYAAVCSLLMLSILFLTLFSVKKGKEAEEPSADCAFTAQTEYVYVYVSPDETEKAPVDSSGACFWTVREYEERIGIFNSDGILVHVIERHIKTLPVADRDLLREGIKVNSRKELLSVIEDYTG